MKILVFLGSVRTSTPPRPARLGERVARATLAWLRGAGHEVELIDPLDLNLPTSFKPQFAYAKGRAPAALDQLAEKIAAADGYVAVSPEYNHSMSPALADLLNHFGSSLFSFKPSAIVTYSAGQWGGARAAVNMRTFLAELGCLPGFSHGACAAGAGGFLPRMAATCQTWMPPAGRGYLGRSLLQLEWWAEAARQQRAGGLPTDAFVTAPSQRNAP